MIEGDVVVINQWEHYFKPEVRSSGRMLVSKGQVSLKQPSDTELVAFLKVSGGVKVHLKLSRVDSPEVKADCTCPLFKKGQFCKHLWGTLVEAQQKNPDFFEGKIELSIQEFQFSTKASVDSSDRASDLRASPADQERALKNAERHQQTLEAQSLYRKLQYQKQKLRLKKLKLAKEPQALVPEFPDFVEEALQYFMQNGFDLRATLTKDSVNFAKKKLARVFHPDLGGSHQEILDLNKFAEVLSKFSGQSEI